MRHGHGGRRCACHGVKLLSCVSVSDVSPQAAPPPTQNTSEPPLWATAGLTNWFHLPGRVLLESWVAV